MADLHGYLARKAVELREVQVSMAVAGTFNHRQLALIKAAGQAKSGRRFALLPVPDLATRLRAGHASDRARPAEPQSISLL